MTSTTNDWPAAMAGWDPTRVQAFRRDLLAWYDQHRRDLPWRQTRDPYAIWVSEIMLQQTQVATVIPYYQRFLAALPTIGDLAAAEEATLLNLWQGLGYYSRVRNMQAAAQQVMADFEGQMPDDLAGLLTLKGIGPYTAAAIASMAFGRVTPALDGNLYRIVARLFRLDLDIALPKHRKDFMAILEILIDPERPGDFNQAMMDLGATVMTPTNSRPDPHPLAAYDASYQYGDSDRYPVKSKKVKATRHALTAYYVVDAAGRWLMRRHGEDELLTGLWHFPLIEQAVVYEAATPAELTEPLRDWLLDTAYEPGAQVDVQLVQPAMGQVKHVFSHRVWQVTLVGLQLTGTGTVTPDWTWVTPDQVGALPLSTLQQKLLQLVVGEREMIR